jgi:hypothetical protein
MKWMDTVGRLWGHFISYSFLTEFVARRNDFQFRLRNCSSRKRFQPQLTIEKSRESALPKWNLISHDIYCYISWLKNFTKVCLLSADLQYTRHQLVRPCLTSPLYLLHSNPACQSTALLLLKTETKQIKKANNSYQLQPNLTQSTISPLISTWSQPPFKKSNSHQ